MRDWSSVPARPTIFMRCSIICYNSGILSRGKGFYKTFSSKFHCLKFSSALNQTCLAIMILKVSIASSNISLCLYWWKIDSTFYDETRLFNWTFSYLRKEWRLVSIDEYKKIGKCCRSRKIRSTDLSSSDNKQQDV